MELILNYIKPELVVLAIALYFLGRMLKNAETIADKFIPALLGLTGIILSLIYVLANSDISTAQNILRGIFTGIVQGILAASLSTYVNQMIKQSGKDE
ncbi:MAG: phage holin family protein [Bacteroides sp.]|nr:phage holin family protein [Bacteroides sp.]MCM1549609.1 phage holin family protein [Clostridium sp.]